MIQLQSKLNIVDNSGALKARVIKTKKKFARLGEKVVVSIQKNIPYSKIRKGDIAKAILIRSKCRESLISHSQI
jgi:large subunit ribosomal protein L14